MTNRVTRRRWLSGLLGAASAASAASVVPLLAKSQETEREADPVPDPQAITRYQEQQAVLATQSFVGGWNDWISKVDLSVRNAKSIADFRKVKKAWNRVDKSFAALGFK